jgi:hypothetical protein
VRPSAISDSDAKAAREKSVANEEAPLTAAIAIEALIKRLRFMPEKLSFFVDECRPTRANSGKI